MGTLVFSIFLQYFSILLCHSLWTAYYWNIFISSRWFWWVVYCGALSFPIILSLHLTIFAPFSIICVWMAWRPMWCEWFAPSFYSYHLLSLLFLTLFCHLFSWMSNPEMAAMVNEVCSLTLLQFVLYILLSFTMKETGNVCSWTVWIAPILLSIFLSLIFTMIYGVFSLKNCCNYVVLKSLKQLSLLSCFVLPLTFYNFSPLSGGWMVAMVCVWSCSFPITFLSLLFLRLFLFRILLSVHSLTSPQAFWWPSG